MIFLKNKVKGTVQGCIQAEHSHISVKGGRDFWPGV
jgi:hypothetical protein